MKQYLFTLVVAMLFGILVSGCDLNEPEAKSPTPIPEGEDLIVSEVFTISPSIDKQHYAYSWIEFYNPTSTPLPWLTKRFPATFMTTGEDGELNRTTNDGDDWAPWSASMNTTIHSMTFFYPDTGLAVGPGGAIFRSPDRGRTWIRLNGNTTNDLHSISFPPVGDVPNTQRGFAVGDNGTVVVTKDRGASWDTVPFPAKRHIRASGVSLTTKMLLCGDLGLIAKSSNTGARWDTLRNVPRTDVNFHGIISNTTMNDTFFVLGEKGVILSTIDFGQNWSIEQSGVTRTLRAGTQVFAERGHQRRNYIIVGDSGLILRSSDYGKSWSRASAQGVNVTLRGVQFVSESRGWAYGDNGTLLTTLDSGKTWKTVNSGTTKDIYTGIFERLNTQITSRYLIQMDAMRKKIFLGGRMGFNFDFYTVDSGTVIYDPLVNEEITGAATKPVPPHGFAVLVSDSGKFKDHTDYGPGDRTSLNVPIAFFYDSTYRADLPNGEQLIGVRPVLWTLLASSEIQLIKIYMVQDITVEDQPVFLDFYQEVIDVVRIGGYVPTPNLYPNNKPTDIIPEWWSLARYQNDVGGPLNTLNTAASFYLCNKPIPGWVSQRLKP